MWHFFLLQEQGKDHDQVTNWELGVCKDFKQQLACLRSEQNKNGEERRVPFSWSWHKHFHSCSWQLLAAEPSVFGIMSLTPPLSLGLCHWPLPFLWDYITDHSPFSGSQAFSLSLVIPPVSLAFHLKDGRPRDSSASITLIINLILSLYMSV